MRHILYLGERYKTISRVLKVSKSTVVSIIWKWKKLPRAVRPTKHRNQKKRTLVREVTKNPMTTWTELQSPLAEMGEPTRRITVFTAFHQSGLYGRVARWKPLLRKRHMTAPLGFAKRHVKDFECIRQMFLWSDEANM
uniref:Transposase Tc1-like domain-containing protein n=1 Tax=Oncorhynchus tshawytscha TaxID=74940 RepID=A0AAZ3RQB1_ONCTS